MEIRLRELTFSPNVDAIDEELAIVFSFLALTVFDRWGSPVYHTSVATQLKSGDKLWNGKNGNTVLSKDYHTYSLKVKTPARTLYNNNNGIHIIDRLNRMPFWMEVIQYLEGL